MVKIKCLISNLLLLSCIILSTHGLYEDQVGKFDWRARHIGCPNQVLYNRLNDRDILLILSKENAMASLDVTNGDIVWRQIQDVSESESRREFTYDRERELVIVHSESYIRAFDSTTGTLKWETFVDFNQRPGFLRVLDDSVIVSSGSVIYGIRLKNGAILWSTDTKDQSEWVGMAKNGDNIHLFGGVSTQKSSVIKLNLENGSIQNRVNLNLDYSNRCVVNWKYAACIDNHGHAFIVDLAVDKPIFTKAPLERVSSISTTQHDDYFVAKSSDLLHVLHVFEGKIFEVLKLENTDVFTLSLESLTKDPIFVSYYEPSRTAKAYNLRSGKHIASAQLQNQAPISTIDLLVSGNTFEFLTVQRDCRVDLQEVTSENTKSAIEWTRFEGLASISSVEMIDLPLSETQATIETEFSDDDTDTVKTFARRVSSQIELFKKSFIAISHRLVKSFEMITTNQASFSTVFRHLLGDEIRRSPKSLRTGSTIGQNELPMERDYFNLRKMIVVSTMSGSLYGIHNEDGSVVWSLYLGDDFEPLKDLLGRFKVPIFVQRGTSHYQFSSQAAVAFNSKNNKGSRVVEFNPITGSLINTYQIARLKRIDLLPFTNDELLHPIITTDINNKIDVFPSFKIPPPYPIFQFNFDVSTGDLYGEKVDLATRKGSSTWRNKLRLSKGEKIVSIASKSLSQKVHSQGRVLGDRSVLYKYSNPNLVALATYDEAESTLTIYMVDSVTGQIVYTGRHNRSRPPFHLVHCENWLAYSYWNEKARRTEIGIIELYEGLTQTNTIHFNSLTSEKTPLTVYAQSYIFSQGINAMTATETEQGLTNRALIVALPFGGLLEIQKRFVDARRTIEMTPELREEMVIPYMPELLIATEDLINYNQTIYRQRGIKTSPSGLESTSLVLSYGLDLFYTRVSPSGSFDLLKDDFDYVLIALDMAPKKHRITLNQYAATAREAKKAKREYAIELQMTRETLDRTLNGMTIYVQK